MAALDIAALKGLASINASKSLSGFNSVEKNIIKDAQGILNSSDMDKLVQAYNKGESFEIVVNGRKIVCEPDAPVSGMTLFGENGFVL